MKVANEYLRVVSEALDLALRLNALQIDDPAASVMIEGLVARLTEMEKGLTGGTESDEDNITYDARTPVNNYVLR